MSFISILRRIGTVALGIEHIASPLVGALVPGAGPAMVVLDSIFAHVQTAIVTVEANNPVTAAGPQKADAVVADFQAGLDVTNQVLALEGKTLTYDGALLQKAIADQVSAYNGFAAVKASFKVVPLVKAV